MVGFGHMAMPHLLRKHTLSFVDLGVQVDHSVRIFVALVAQSTGCNKTQLMIRLKEKVTRNLVLDGRVDE